MVHKLVDDTFVRSGLNAEASAPEIM